MFKYVFSAMLCLALTCPSVTNGQDCGCCEPAPAPCVKTRKKLALVSYKAEVCKRKVVCTTDECGCSKRKVVSVKECVTRKKLALVDVAVDPCKRNCFQKLGDRLCAARDRAKAARSANACCEPAPCGCTAPCGCN